MNESELPSGWVRKPLANLARIVSGGTPARDNPEFWENGTIPWATPTDITNGNSRILTKINDYITEAGLRGCSAKLLPAGSILMTSRATLGESKIAGTEICTNQGFKSLVPYDHVDNWFLYYLMRLNKGRYETFGIGSTFLEVNKKDTEAFELDLPPLPEQRKIARILSTVDEKIERTEALIAKYQAMKQGLMHDLLTRGVDAQGRLRPPREQAPELYKWSALGWVPRGWEVERLDAVASYQHGRSFPSSDYGNSGIPLLRPGNLQNEDLVIWDVGHTTFLPEKWGKKATNYIVEENELVMNLTAQSLEDQFLGRVCLTPSGTHCLLNQRIARFHSMSCSILFLFWSLKGPFFRTQIDNVSQGTKVQHLYDSNLKSVLLPIPNSLEEQTAISDKLFSVSDLINQENRQLAKLAVLKTGLMQDLLTGRVRVEVDGEKNDSAW